MLLDILPYVIFLRPEQSDSQKGNKQKRVYLRAIPLFYWQNRVPEINISHLMQMLPQNSPAGLTSSKKALEVSNNFFSKYSTERFWANSEKLSAKNIPIKNSL
jgi:hypothetical protein